MTLEILAQVRGCARRMGKVERRSPEQIRSDIQQAALTWREFAFSVMSVDTPSNRKRMRHALKCARRFEEYFAKGKP